MCNSPPRVVCLPQLFHLRCPGQLVGAATADKSFRRKLAAVICGLCGRFFLALRGRRRRLLAKAAAQPLAPVTRSTNDMSATGAADTRSVPFCAGETHDVLPANARNRQARLG